ncbi:MAG: CoB--CoM heterodisulfide reductase iron-sulfur subunit B family protein [Thermoanaerobaculaceae bacterium]|jgi:heterodisulfide reductase subunit B|nr:CoB--CoM heterodisulfide reductase iron-sulfur subunit B family protein [Thermoanaerobaculaceae bacterium]
MRIGYYPGCSLHATARELDESLRAVASALDLELQELDDWSCCGATSGHATNHLLSLALPARNLALAEAQGHDRVLAPCAACYNRLATARHEIAADAALAARVARVLERPFANRVTVANLVEVLRELGPAITARAGRSLAGLKVACYYGCLLVRPAAVVGFDDPEQPTSMEDVVRAAGATPVAWQMRLECCGGAFSLARTASVVRLGRAILDDARRAGAEALVVACPMCHSNLDFRQSAMLERGEKPLPVLYLSELVGLALGIAPDTLGLQRHFVDARPLAARAAAEVH